jgi:hypothetical protein
MKLVLHYRGELFANGSPTHKHDLRRHFHRQLKTLWGQRPLVDDAKSLLQTGKQAGDYCLLRPFPPFVFVPLISAEMYVVCDISVVLMRPEPPGSLITSGGDMDNRLKTLFDAMTMPRHANAMPKTGPQADETPHFFCLLEDDNLIVRLDVRTEQLLEPQVGKNEVDLAISVRTHVTRVTMGNSDFV